MLINQIIEQLERFQAQLLVDRGGAIEIASPDILGPTIVKIRILLVQMIEKIAEIELDYRKAKSRKYDELVKSGMKKSPALDQLEMDEDLIAKKIEVERIKGYQKYVDSMCSAVQSAMRVTTEGEKKGY